MNHRLVMTLIAALLVANCASDQQTQQKSGPIEAGENIAVVSTTYGDVRGYIDDGV